MLLTPTLTATKHNWQRFVGRQKNEKFIDVQQKVLTRDERRCRFCGFQSQKYQYVVNIDHDYTNNKLANLATTCSLCLPCFFIESIGTTPAMGGMLIHLPEISQADLNHFCRALFCSLFREAPYKGKLQATYLSLQDRSQAIEIAFGPKSSDPHVFGQSLLDNTLTPEQKKHPILSEFRFLPARKNYNTQAEYWKSTVFANIPL